MKLRNVEIFLQRKFSKSFSFIDNRQDEKPFTALKKPLKESKVALITSAGLYKKDETPFDTDALLGDTSYRVIKTSDDLTTLDIAHTHYDHKFIKEDINTVYPMKHLEYLQETKVIGELSDIHFSFSGFVLDTDQLINETAEGILKHIQENNIDVVLLAPVWPVCNQSVGLVARHLEAQGIPTVTLNMFREVGEYNQPPRIVYTDHEFGAPFGKPHDDTTQLQLLNECLNAFS